MITKLFFIIRDFFDNLRLNRKIQLSLMLIIVPLFILFVLLFSNMYHFNQQYDRIISNASEAGRFSIDFQEEFDYKIYLIIAGHSTFEKEEPYLNIEEAREIVSDLIKNTSSPDNKRRAEDIMKLLTNLEKYAKQIEENKRIGGFYDENINIWENYVQIATSLVHSNMLEYTYYETIGMEQVRAGVTESLQKITLLSLTVFMFLFIMALFLSVVIPNSIVKPIHKLNEVTNQVAKGDLSVRVRDVTGAEVRRLGRSLNIMIEKIDNLLHAIKVDEENLRSAELELLQAQINPHFLYNTLDTIIWLSESGKQDQVVDMVSALSDFFRTSLNHGDGLFTLREEERHVHSYLQIQQVRYQDILEYEINIPEVFYETVLPKITIQPLVENALYHGIKNRRGGGRIEISARLNNHDVIVSVKDNGIGMSESRLKHIITNLDKEQVISGRQIRDSYGLYNVNQRIKLKFGKRYGLSISSVYGEGTCVSVSIPYIDPNHG